MRILLLAIATFAAAAANARADPPAALAERFEREWPPIIAALEQAALDSDVVRLRAAQEALRPWVTAAPPARTAMVHYALAYCSWRLSFLPATSTEQRETIQEEARDHLLEAVRIQPRWAESQALLASVYGRQIGLSPMRGMTLGPRAGFHMSQALKLEPRNPRVVLMQGISNYHTPAGYGGGLDKAEQALREAVALFAHEPTDRPWPNWGRFDAHVWLGQTLAKKGDRAGARREYEAALEIAPGSTWVTFVLLPAVTQDGKPGGKPARQGGP